jgi:hypothetical protein
MPELEPFFRRLCLEQEKLILPVMQSVLTFLGWRACSGTRTWTCSRCFRRRGSRDCKFSTART